MPAALQAQTLTVDNDFFESVYADAQGVVERVPWADERAHPSLITWLNATAPSLVRCGARVIVVGCGLGDDARELIQRGYEVTAFDCSPTAIRWARSRDTGNEQCYLVEDLFNLPVRWRHRYDLVVEINTIQSLPIERRLQALRSVASLASPHGHVLVICRGTDHPAPADDGPPWPLTESELLDLAAQADLIPTEGPTLFEDDEVPPVRRIRAVFRRT